MKRAGLVFCGLAVASADHPIKKVIDLLQKLRRTATDEARSEELAFTEFSHWCVNEKNAYSEKIAKNKDNIQILEEKIAGLEASNEALREQIKNLGDEISNRQADQTNANDIRSTEKGLYDTSKSDLNATIQAIKDALQGLKDSKPSELAQVKIAVKKAAVAASTALTKAQHKVLHAFLQEEPVTGTGRVRKYDFKSGGVIGLLEQLRDDFQAQLLDTNKAETNAINAHELTTKAQDAAIAAAEKSKSKKEQILSEQESTLATAQSDLDSERTDLGANEKTLSDTTTECDKKSRNFEQRTKTREGEQAAMAQAIEILEKSSGIRSSEHAVAKDGEHGDFVEFLQLSDPRSKVVELIHNAARVHHSAQLERLAQQVRVSSGPFKQIKNMIQKMVFRLNKEQTDEDNHKNWCDTEIETTEQSLDEKKSKLSKLDAEIEKLKSRIANLEENIKQEEDTVAEVSDNMKTRTQIRAENKKENAKTIEDSKEAQIAVANAIAVLEDFYKSSGGMAKEAWEFIQLEQDPLSNTAATTDFKSASGDESFGGTSGAGNVIGTLKTVLEDYGNLEAETTSQEDQDSNDFDEFMGESRTELARARQEIKMKTAKKNTAEKNLASTRQQHKKTSNQKGALDQYMVDLKPSCIDGDSTYEERKAARASEIGALQQALDVLADAFKPKSFLQRV